MQNDKFHHVICRCANRWQQPSTRPVEIFSPRISSHNKKTFGGFTSQAVTIIFQNNLKQSFIKILQWSVAIAVLTNALVHPSQRNKPVFLLLAVRTHAHKPPTKLVIFRCVSGKESGSRGTLTVHVDGMWFKNFFQQTSQHSATQTHPSIAKISAWSYWKKPCHCLL